MSTVSAVEPSVDARLRSTGGAENQREAGFRVESGVPLASGPLCPSCQARNRVGACFCAYCGTPVRAPTQGPPCRPGATTGFPTRQLPVTRQLDPRQAYYARLAEALVQDGFRAGDRLITKEEIVEDAGRAIALAGGVLSLVAPQLALFYDPLLRAATKANVVGGDEVERVLSPLASRFVLLAHNSKVGATRVFAALDGDELTMLEAEARATALLRALSSLTGKGLTVQIGVSLLFAFFDHTCAVGSAGLILDRCYLNRWNRRLNRVCITPIVCDVPARLLHYKRNPTIIPGVATVSREALECALY